MAALIATTTDTDTLTSPHDRTPTPAPVAPAGPGPGTKTGAGAGAGAVNDLGAEETLGIAEVAERMGLTAHTLRYYERIGLLDVPRDAGGRRRYSAGDLARVHFITCLRKADLPINQIQHYFKLVEAGTHTEGERLTLLEDHRHEVLRRLAELQTALETIEFKITMYGGRLGDALTSEEQPVPAGG